MIKTYQYRIYPTIEQEQALEQVLSLCCELYNACLTERREAYRLQGKALSFFEQKRELVEVKQIDERFRLIPSHVLQDTVHRVDKAYQAFFRRLKQNTGKAGFPRYRSRRRYNTFTFPDLSGFKVENNRLKLLRIGDIRIILHRPLPVNIKQLHVSRKASGWYALFVADVPTIPLPSTGRKTGVDAGIESFMTTSEGEFFDNPKFLRQSTKKLRRKQRQVARSKRGSQRRRKRVQELARLHEHIVNQRRDYIFKVVKSLVQRYDVIAVEDLRISNMVQNHHLAQSILDAAWGLFFAILTSKAEEAGRQVIAVNPRNTSQQCSRCGTFVPKNLGMRWHECPVCGLSVHRDVNAAINILQLAG